MSTVDMDKLFKQAEKESNSFNISDEHLQQINEEVDSMIYDLEFESWIIEIMLLRGR